LLVGLGLSLGVEVGWLFLCRVGVHFSEKFGRGFFHSGLVDVEHPEPVDAAYPIIQVILYYLITYYIKILFSIISYAILFYEIK